MTTATRKVISHTSWYTLALFAVWKIEQSYSSRRKRNRMLSPKQISVAYPVHTPGISRRRNCFCTHIDRWLDRSSARVTRACHMNMGCNPGSESSLWEKRVDERMRTKKIGQYQVHIDCIVVHRNSACSDIGRVDHMLDESKRRSSLEIGYFYGHRCPASSSFRIFVTSPIIPYY